MEISDFEDCCGISILHNFGYSTTEDYYNSWKPLEVIKEKVQRFIKGRGDYSWSGGLLLVALNKFQINSGIEEILLDAGFKKLCDKFYNPIHFHECTLYGYEKYPTKNKNYVPEDRLEAEPEVKPKRLFAEPVAPKEPAVRRVVKKVVRKKVSSDW